MKELNSKKFCVVQLGARHKYSIPIFFYNKGLLHSFFTNGYNKGIVKFLFGANKLTKKRETGSFEPIYSFNILGLAHYFLRKIFKTFSVSTNNYVFLFAAFLLNIFTIIRILFMRIKPSHFYVNNGGGYLLFKFFNKKYKIVEQVIGPRMFMNEKIKIDDISAKYFKNNLGIYENDLRQKVEILEWKYADLILCPSNFVFNLLIRAGVKESKLKLINYGVNIAPFEKGWKKNRVYDSANKLKILFVGEVGVRKGAAYLLEAIKQLNIKYECRFVGTNLLNKKIENKNVEIVGVVDKSKIADYFLWADVFVIPSLFEGSATVIYEATASGLPVIASENSGPPETSNIITINSLNPNDIAKSIEYLVKNYSKYLPNKDDLYHVSSERYHKELETLL